MPESIPSTFDSDALIKTLPVLPGVYQMRSDDGTVIYVGKARVLKKRVASYFSGANRSIKTLKLVSQIRKVDVIVTHTEAEALILENRLIKKLSPKYNILLRDDKSYPYLRLSTSHPFPVLSIYRGVRRTESDKFFGPYASSSAARFALHHLQTVFKLRQCSNQFFANRSRPCLQYQIFRCSGPCVGYISREDYALKVDQVVQFLNGDSAGLQADLIKQMDSAAKRLAFEEAATLRDQIGALNKIQARQAVEGEQGDLDLLGFAASEGRACVQLFMIRSGQNLGGRPFFLGYPRGTPPTEALSAFISQYYETVQPPPEIITGAPIDDVGFLETALAEKWGRRLQIRSRCRAQRARYLAMAQENASIALASRENDLNRHRLRFESLQTALDLPKLPSRVEAFDISHTQGDSTVASCVVFDANGPCTSAYRRFNISGITGGDDYAAMAQVLTRHYTRVAREEEDLESLVILIDGGKGQLSVAFTILSGVLPTLPVLVGIGKGPERTRLSEIFYQVDEDGEAHPIELPEEAANLLRETRDEAHRFAITTHRKKRSKKVFSSPLDDISGLGPKRRQNLLKSFGGLQGVASAGVDDLSRVKGISRKMAELIYEKFHS